MKRSNITPKMLDKAYATVTRFAAKRGMTRDKDYDKLADWDGVAHEALMRADSTYNPALSSFATWSTRMVMQELRTHARRDSDRLVTIPEAVAVLAAKVQRTRAEFVKENLRQPTNKELGAACDLSGQALSDAMAAYFVHHYQCDTSGEEYDIVDEALDLEESLYIQDLYSRFFDELWWNVSIGVLPAESAHVLCDMYGYGGRLPMTQHEIASERGMTQSDVSRYHTMGIDLLKKLYARAA